MRAKNVSRAVKKVATCAPLPTDPTSERLAGLPSRLLGLASLRADRIVAAALSSVSGHKWHYAVLVALDEGGPASQTELRRRTGLYPSDLVGVLDALEARNYARRSADPSDARRNVIHVTSRGSARLRELGELVSAAQARVLEPLTADDRETLVRLLRELVAS